ncbi:aspartate/glutamate racemase family protein [Actinocorallia sp. A-T 12471]|uniref:aspartate/glutamate racemase family protein n=1 Tax=Actinocorallia sp. A-T 12471 TaxID=3089813 RepID=UPI0029CB1D89|nr:aspartate/glutamate racemase family protein [Actinocorallia sp. A-T 12471]MDX6739640.1 aspartate/glutamate racemase family protein [Actinocorallia sp. A-T 12471]
MRIWHQSFTVLDDVPHYRDALSRHLKGAARPGTTVELHGMAAGTYPGSYPGVHIGHLYLTNLHREQFVKAALRAEAEGYDAFFIATIPDTGYEEIRTLVDIPVVAFGNASVAFAATVGSRVGIVNFIGELEPQLRRNMQAYGFGDVVGPIVQVEAGFTDVMGAYADPGPLVAAFERAAREAIRLGANVIVPGEGPLNVFLADQGISRVDDVPVIDSLGTGLALAETRAVFHRRSGLYPPRTGLYFTRPDAELLAAARAFYYGGAE